MNNDLISRDYVSNKICGLYSDGEKANKKDRTINEVMDIIDNAPTVEIDLVKVAEEHEKIGFKKGFNEGYTQAQVDLERPQGESVIKCQDCKYRVNEWREDKRMKDKGYWVYGCKHFGEIMGYWGFGGNDNEFCSDAEQKGGAV